MTRIRLDDNANNYLMAPIGLFATTEVWKGQQPGITLRFKKGLENPQGGIEYNPNSDADYEEVFLEGTQMNNWLNQTITDIMNSEGLTAAEMANLTIAQLLIRIMNAEAVTHYRDAVRE